MSTFTSVSTSKRGAAPAGDPGRARRGFRWSRLWWLAPVLVLCAVFEPHCFRLLLGQALRLEGWRHGARVQLARVEGSVFEPVIFHGTQMSRVSGRGTVLRLEVKEATASFSWRNLFKQGSARWLERVTLDGVSGKMELLAEPMTEPERWTVRRWLPDMELTPAPGRVEVRGIDFVIQTNGDYVRIQDARCTLSNAEPGSFAAGQLIVKQPWLERTFRDLRGTTKIDGSEIGIDGVELEPGVKLERFAAELDELARGDLNAAADFSAFDGKVRVEAQTLAGQAALTEMTVTQEGVNLAKLAAFLATPSAAGGTMKYGKLTFRGSPRRPADATATLRIDATNFQWDARQWDSLVLSARLMNSRLEVLQLALLQGRNRLDVDGEMALPGRDQRWWQSDFDARIKAQIEDLTALSALLLPEFRYAAGRAKIEGAMRRRQDQIDGQLIVNGFGLQWRSAPIEELQAALKFTGHTLEVVNIALFNDGDFLRGRGEVNLRAPTEYHGELRASVQDLATYAALLQPPIVPEAIAGGATVTWQGEGTATGQKGSFRAHLNKLRSLGATATLRHPINAVLEGTYEPGRVAFTQFSLADDVSSFSANVKIGDRGVSLGAIALRHKNELWLEGDALLPLDLWKAWPNTSLAGLLDDTAPTSVRLRANGLGLHEAAALSGWSVPVFGRVSGQFTAEGQLGALQTGGTLTLTGGRMPLGVAGREWQQVEATLSFRDQTMQVEKGAGEHPAGDFRATGTVDFSQVRAPQWQLALESERLWLGLGGERGWLSAAFRGTCEGRATMATVRGEARVLSLAVPPLDLASLWLEAGERSLPERLAALEPGLAGWSLDVPCVTAEPLPLDGNPGRVSLAGRLSGTLAAPRWSGLVSVSEVAAAVGPAPVCVESGALDFRPGHPGNPSLLLTVAGTVLDAPFRTHFTGPLSLLLRDTAAVPPLEDPAVRDFLLAGRRGVPGVGARFALPVPAILSGGAEVYEWAPIGSPPPPEAPPATPP